MELQLVALGGCGAMDVISILRKMRQEVTSYRVRLDAKRAEEHPRVYTSIVMTHHLAGTDLSEPNVKRAVQLSMSRYCPVFAMISPTVPVQVQYEVTDAGGAVKGSGAVEVESPAQ